MFYRNDVPCCGILFLYVLLGVVTGTSQAETRSWTNPSGGQFGGPANWSDASVPGPADIARFDLDATYIVNFNSSVTNKRLHLYYHGDVTLDLNGAVYTLTDADAVEVGFYGRATNRLTVTNGVLSVNTTGDNVEIGGYSSDKGFLTVSSGGQLGNGTTNPQLIVGRYGDGTFTINNNGQALVNSLSVGQSTGSTGSVTVTDPQSLLTVDGSSLIGNSSLGVMTVSNGGQVSSAGFVSLGEWTSGNGLATISGFGSRWSIDSSIDIGYNGYGELSVAYGGQFSTTTMNIGNLSTGKGLATVIGSGATLFADSINVAISGAGALKVAEAAEVFIGNSLSINDPTGTPGTLDLDGGAIYVGGNFSNDGVVNFTDGLLQVVGNFQPGGAPTPFSLDGADADDLPTLDLIGSGATTNVTSLTVGANRRGQLLLRQGRLLNLGGNDINIGALPGGEGIVTVESGAEIQTNGTLAVGGQGTTSGGAGTLNIKGGSLMVDTLSLFNDGEINFDGGALSVGIISSFDGTFNWTSGELISQTLSSLSATNVPRLLGLDRTLRPGQTLTTFSPVDVTTPVIVDGGRLNVDTLYNQSMLDLRSGHAGGDVVLNGGLILMNGPLAVLSGNQIQNEHTLRGTGTIEGDLLNASTGQVEVIAGERLRLAGTSNSNYGHISVIGGELQVDNALTNAASSTGLISARDAILRFNTVTNNGSMAFSNGTVDVYGDITQNVGGRITVSNGGIANFYEDVTISAGAANVQATALGSTVSRVVFFGSYNGGVTGGGQAFIEGDHRPGYSPAVVTFGGDLFYGPFATLEIELAGTTQDDAYDSVAVAGAAVLGGTLDVSRLGTFSPSLGDTFEILTGGGDVNGTFASTLFPDLGALLAMDVFYDTNTVTLAVVPALAGDFDIDGDVDGADFMKWQRGKSPNPLSQSDLADWQANFGIVASSAAATSTAVPEPATGLLLMLGMAVVLFRRHAVVS